MKALTLWHYRAPTMNEGRWLRCYIRVDGALSASKQRDAVWRYWLAIGEPGGFGPIRDGHKRGNDEDP